MFFKMENNKEEKFHYVYSSALDSNVQIKIGTLQGKLRKPDHKELLTNPMLKFSGIYTSDFPDLMVECDIFSNGKPLALPITSSYKAFSNRWDWNEWLLMPLLFSDLPRNAQLAITIYDCVGPGERRAVGGTTISLFGKNGVFRRGMIDLIVWPDTVADGNFPSKTPGKCGEDSEMRRLTKLKKRHAYGQIEKCDWLDRLAFSKIEQITQREKEESNFLYLNVEFPFIHYNNIPHAVVYYEQDGDEVYQCRRQGEIVNYPDNEILKENLCEAKHHILARSVRSGVSDRDAKPTAHERDQLMKIVLYPPTKTLSTEEQDLVWKFRFYLMNQKKALTKFLKCVNWKLPLEAKQALNLVKQWAPMDVEDALELLGPNFDHPGVRRYAVSRLAQALDEDLLLYLLQLVQALKYENYADIQEEFNKIDNGKDSFIGACQDSRDSLSERQSTGSDARQSLSSSLENSSQTQALAEALNESPPLSSATSTSSSLPVVSSAPISLDVSEINTNSVASPPPPVTVTAPPPFTALVPTITEGACNVVPPYGDKALSTFLISRACDNSTLANYFYWYLLIECEDHDPPVKQDCKVRQMYLNVLKTFTKTLQNGGSEWVLRRDFLHQQQTFIDKLVRLIKTVQRESGNRKKKTERLQALLAESETFKMNFSNFNPIPFPLDPEVKIKGIIPEKATIFKSALMPSRFTFKTIDDKEYLAIFKHGDDLRQDQLILQMITLMDKLLRRENLDLKLTPYRVQATSAKHGFVQFIESTTVAEVLATENSIQNFFRKHHPCESAPYGIAPEVMDTYVRSCAGYCVITYLLGVGDRHLDNLLLTTEGKLFHIDFGYILGRDPKPLPPPMKLSKEMVEAMGGINSEHFQEFRKQCHTAFLHLRRHANLMLNLFSLMVDASVPDIALEPDKAVKKVQDKLRLDLGDEEAVLHLQNLLEESVSAVMAVLVEQLHKFAQYWRK